MYSSGKPGVRILKSRSTEHPNLRNIFAGGKEEEREKKGGGGRGSSHNEAIPLVMLGHIKKDPGDLVDFGHLKFIVI